MVGARYGKKVAFEYVGTSELDVPRAGGRGSAALGTLSTSR